MIDYINPTPAHLPSISSSLLTFRPAARHIRNFFSMNIIKSTRSHQRDPLMLPRPSAKEIPYMIQILKEMGKVSCEKEYSDWMISLHAHNKLNIVRKGIDLEPKNSAAYCFNAKTPNRCETMGGLSTAPLFPLFLSILGVIGNPSLDLDARYQSSSQLACKY